MTLKVAILGTGHFGLALDTYLRAKTTISVTIASRSTKLPPSQAVLDADIVVLAVPAHAYHAFVPTFASYIPQSAVVIDAANRPLTILPSREQPVSSACSVRKLLPQEVYVAKGLNTLAAIRLNELANSAGCERSTVVPFAAEGPAVEKVKSLIEEMGFSPDHRGNLDVAKNIEAIPHVLFPSYRSALIVSTIVWTWWILYSTLSTYVIHGRDGEPARPWSVAPLSIFMASTGETAQTLFAITFLAGPLATLIKALGRPLRPTMLRWLDARKQLGLCAFIFVSMHGIAGAISASHIEDGWKGQIYFVFGILSYVTFALLAVCSTGSTSATLSWAEFRTVFSWMGTAAFVTAIIHQGFWGWIILQHIPNPSFWVGGGSIMPIYWVGIILPLFVVLLRLITWTPCVTSAAMKGKSVDAKLAETEA